MADRLYDYSALTDEQRKHLETLETEIQQAQKKILDEAPDHLLQLGGILRRSTETESLEEFRSYLQKHSIDIAGGERELALFRDLLIIRRIDLKDLEPEARQRLRFHTLIQENPKNMSSDYRAAISEGDIPNCRDCRWFVTPPNDGQEGSDKACVEFGTKGADQACYGFTNKLN